VQGQRQQNTLTEKGFRTNEKDATDMQMQALGRQTQTKRRTNAIVQASMKVMHT